MGAEVLLEGRDISHAYGHGSRRLEALRNVSCAIRAGQTLGVVGESGSGKSTLGEILGGLRTPTAGEVLFEGCPVRQLDREGRRRYRRAVQFVFQDPAASMDPHYTVERVLCEPLELLERGLGRDERRGRAREMLARVGLPEELLDRMPGRLSGGQCQRVAIARALMTRPRVVVCDECTSALDVFAQAQILNLLRDLQDELGTAYLFITHDIAVVGNMAHHVLVLDQGAVVESGPCERVLAEPADPYTRALVNAAQG